MLSCISYALLEGALGGSTSVMVKIICEEATRTEFDGCISLAVLCPSNIQALFGKDGACNNVTFVEMEEAGATILIFEKKGC